MRLLDEGTDCWRPVDARLIANGVYEVLGLVPSDEIWEFAPGTHVKCVENQFANGSVGLVANDLLGGVPES